MFEKVRPPPPPLALAPWPTLRPARAWTRVRVFTTVVASLIVPFAVAQVVVVDCRNHMMGRLASIIAKELLNGQKIVSALPLCD